VGLTVVGGAFDVLEDGFSVRWIAARSNHRVHSLGVDPDGVVQIGCLRTELQAVRPHSNL
jgi:hypothetical protein